MEKCTQ